MARCPSNKKGEIVSTSNLNTVEESLGKRYLVMYCCYRHWHTYLDKDGKQLIESRAKAESIKLKVSETLKADGQRAFAVRVVEIDL